MKAPIKEHLIFLGTTESQVAKSLAALDIKGKRSSPYDCPIGVYLRSQKLPVEMVTGSCHNRSGGLAVYIKRNWWARQWFVWQHKRQHKPIICSERDGTWYRFPLAEYPELKGIRDFIHRFDAAMEKKWYPELEAK